MGDDRWAEEALGELLTKPERLGWEVEPLPADGVIGLLLQDPGTTPVAVDSPPSRAHTERPDLEGSGLARLTELLERLPARNARRLTPEDITVETAPPAPPAVWFWGDDDIYSGSAEEPAAARKSLRSVATRSPSSKRPPIPNRWRRHTK